MSEKTYNGYDGPAGLYKLENIDLTDFVYKLHVLPGNRMADAGFHMPLLKNKDCDDFCVIMSDNYIRIGQVDTAYRDMTKLNQLFRNFPHDTRAYLLHVDNREQGRVVGTALLVNSGELCEDIAANTIPITRVVAEMKKGGDEKSFTREEWQALELIDKDSIKSWACRYDFADVQIMIEHYSNFWKQCLDEAESIASDELLGYLNSEYMSHANYPDHNMMRVPIHAAKSMLLHEDAPVYRLFPDGPKQIAPVTAVTTGLWFEKYREFAIKKEDHAGLDKMCRRETDKLLGIAPERKAPDRKPER